MYIYAVLEKIADKYEHSSGLGNYAIVYFTMKSLSEMHIKITIRDPFGAYATTYHSDYYLLDTGFHVTPAMYEALNSKGIPRYRKVASNFKYIINDDFVSNSSLLYY